MQELASLWIGGALGAMERASLVSMVRLGHPVSLYAYAPIADLPPGVTLRDAATILPGQRILVYRDKHKPSPALHANLFRYALLQKTAATWVDLDIVALRPFPETPYVMGLETDMSVNNAVLRLPQGSPTLAALRRFTPQTRGVAPHITGARRVKYWLRTFGRGYPIDGWAWGSTGPKALTLYLDQFGERHHALPPAAFYPIRVQDHAQFLEPGRWRLRDFGDATLALHLWGSRIRRTITDDHGGQVPPGSLYAEILDMFH